MALCLLPLHAQAAPAPANPQLMDVANDNGSAIGITWDWDGVPADGEQPDSFVLEVRINEKLVEHFALSDDEMLRLNEARAWLAGEVAPLLPQLEAADAAMAAANDALTLAIINKESNADIGRKRSDYWQKYSAHSRIDKQITALNESFAARTYSGGEDLRLKALTWEFLGQALQSNPWAEASTATPMSAAMTKASRQDLFGVNIANNPTESVKLFATIDTINVLNPGTSASSDESTGLGQFTSIPVELVPDLEYQVRMSTYGSVQSFEDPSVFENVMDRQIMLGTVITRGNAFDKSKWNNLLFALIFSTIILVFIILARRNPNMFIRRIAGLEAVDEAIGRATEMGKPVLYLTGMQSLSELPTLAAINILGRVAGKIADYESDLIVPNRDPVVQTVAQEVVKEGYLNAGRPDAYREDNIFFLTDDQFSFTAATCGIMMREKPAAIFLMGYYYAESLLLAETGAETGAIQIAGTDSEHQLPFFIVTCDYTLIGEELYAASAYLSREPMLLGSLKGQDVAKGFMLLLILLQALLFIFSPELDFFKDLVTPLN
jgi:hypothetical protein